MSETYAGTARGKLFRLTLTSAFAALICVTAPLSVPVGPVPVSLATLSVMFAGTVLGPLHGTAATAVYLLLGMAGLPVFAGFRGGIGVLAGPTGGYLAGYLPLCAICGIYAVAAARIRKSGKPRSPGAGRAAGAVLFVAACVAGTAVLYTLGTVWFCVVTGSGAKAALSVCVLPFLPGDALKIAACLALNMLLGRRMNYELFG